MEEAARLFGKTSHLQVVSISGKRPNIPAAFTAKYLNY
jgi:hypothetical protein